MAKFIIYKNNGLNNSPVAPTGYKLLGYDSDKLSEKTDNIISPIESGGSGGSGGVIEVTKSELDTLITNEDLDVGSTYKVSGIDANIYDGVTVGWFLAITENRLAEDGVGMFYTPKYDNSLPGFGIVPDYIWWYNNPQVSASINRKNVSVTESSYIWGGKKWIVNSNPGSADYILNDLELDTMYFTSVPFDDVEYNVSYDTIKYNYDTDVIYYRTDGSNTVSFDTIYLLSGGIVGDSKNPITHFMWGNPIDSSNPPYVFGVVGINLDNSLFNNINFSGMFQFFITLTENSYLDYCTFDNYSRVVYLSMSNNSKNQFIYGSNLSYQNNTFNNSSYLGLIKADGCGIENNTFINGSGKSNLTLSDDFKDNFLGGDRKFSISINFIEVEVFQYYVSEDIKIVSVDDNTGILDYINVNGSTYNVGDNINEGDSFKVGVAGTGFIKLNCERD